MDCWSFYINTVANKIVLPYYTLLKSSGVGGGVDPPKNIELEKKLRCFAISVEMLSNSISPTICTFSFDILYFWGSHCETRTTHDNLTVLQNSRPSVEFYLLQYFWKLKNCTTFLEVVSNLQNRIPQFSWDYLNIIVHISNT